MLGSNPLSEHRRQIARTVNRFGSSVVTLFIDICERLLPEIGTLSQKAAGKLVGLAPLARDSGKHMGKRAVRGGRAGIRGTLLVYRHRVRHYNPDFARNRHAPPG
jgi:transposase